MTTGFLLVLSLVCLSVVSLHGEQHPNTSQQSLTKSLTTMEQTLFTVTYDQETVGERLNRIETLVYGSPRTDRSPADRIQQLESVIIQSEAAFERPMSAPSVQQMPPAQQTSSNDPQSSVTPPPISPVQSTPAADESDYPVISMMEFRVLGKVHQQEELSQRLDRLETKVFGGVQQGSLARRTDGLRWVVLGESNRHTMQTETAQTESRSGYGDNNAAPSGDLLAAVTEMERQLLKDTFVGDSLKTRLDRLELEVFHTTSPPDVSDEERFHRLVAVAAAGGNNPDEGKTVRQIKRFLPIVLMFLPVLI